MTTASRRVLNGLLVGGILIRLIVLLSASPFNNDPHFEVIQYIAAHGSLPVSNLLEQSYHPPLYYVLMALIDARWPGPGPIHFFSFVFSVANLLLIRKLLNDRFVVGSESGRVLSFAFICFVPQIVMFGSFISNDTLAMLIGTVVYACAVRYVQQPTTRSRCWLAVAIGTALLTKGTFLLAAPVLTMVVAYVEWHRGWRRAMTMVVTFCLIWGVLGCYKYGDNLIRVGNPLVTNLDVDSVFKQQQSGTWKGWQTACDINVIKLIRQPVLQTTNTFSYPLLMYGTFWYPHIADSSFDGNLCGYQWVGSIIYATAIVPTLIFITGVVIAAMTILRLLANRRSADDERRDLVVVIALGLLLSNALIVLLAGVKYDVWSVFQSRLCFASLVPAITLFGVGIQKVSERKVLGKITGGFCWLTVAAAMLYFCVEVPLTYGWLPRGPVTPQYVSPQ